MNEWGCKLVILKAFAEMNFVQDDLERTEICQ
jgi:hypothetical protein